VINDVLPTTKKHEQVSNHIISACIHTRCYLTDHEILDDAYHNAVPHFNGHRRCFDVNNELLSV